MENISERPESQCNSAPADHLEEAAAEIQRIVALHPERTDFGFGIFDERGLSPEERETEFKRNRAIMFEERSLLQFMAARAWLHGQQKRKTIYRKGTSYWLKHVASHDIGYVTNGMFIAAAVSAGFQIGRVRSWRDGSTPNAWFNISKRAWRRREGGRA